MSKLALDPVLLEFHYGASAEYAVVADENRHIFWMNKAAKAGFGYESEDLVGRSTDILYASKQDHERIGRERDKSATVMTPTNSYVNFKRQSGEVFPAEITGGRMVDEDGEVRGYFGLVRDMSEQQHLSQTLHSLYAITSDAELSRTDKIQKILEIGCRHYDLDVGIVSLIEGDQYSVLHCVSPDDALEPGVSFDLGSTYCTHTLTADGPKMFHRAGNSEIRTHPCYEMFKLESYIGVPIIVEGTRFGTLNFSAAEAREPFTHHDKEMILLFAAWVSQELSVERSMARLAQRAETDFLTGMQNKLGFERGKRAAWLATRRNNIGAAFMLDLDYFKSINDTYGHEAGDKVLAKLGQVLRDNVRADDMLARVGGEEFCAIMPGMHPITAERFAEYLVSLIGTMEVEHDGQTIRTTISIGFSIYDSSMESIKDWITRADIALYQAKSEGRNRSCDARRVHAQEISRAR
ncbi:diguanylate cyclase [Celeribacter arenosi]